MKNKIIGYGFLSILILMLVIVAIQYIPTIVYHYYHFTQKWVQYKDSFYYPKMDNPQKIVFFISDRNLDEFWNGRYIETNQALKISNILIKNNIMPILYRRIDANHIYGIYTPFEVLTKQFINIHNEFENFKNEKFPEKEVIYFAHGDGCYILLQSIIHYHINNSKVILTNCGYTDSLIDYYGELIFSTMKKIKVDNNIITISQKEWEKWKSRGNYEEISDKVWQEKQKKMVEEKVHPDLIAFRKTISNFQKKENLKYLIEMKNTYFLKNLENLLKKKKTKVYHLISEFDEEMPVIYKNFFKKYNQHNYTFYMIHNTDHFLSESKEEKNSQIEISLSRKNPFNQLSKNFIQIFLSIILNKEN